MKKLTALVFVLVCVLGLVGCNGNTSEAREQTTVDDWGIQVSAENVSPSGLKLVITQSGSDPAASFAYGSYYWLEQYCDGEWVDVEFVPQEYEVGWTTEAHLLNMNGVTNINIDWEWLYGALSAGRYRIGKVIDNGLTSDALENRTYYAEFSING